MGERPGDDVRVVAGVTGSRDATRAAVADLLDEAGFRSAFDTITALPAYAPTPVVDRPDLAARFGVASVAVKDESSRLGMKSFKALGGTYAVHRAYDRWRSAATSSPTRPFVATCVTDGNHGAAVAYGARELGVRCVVYLPDVVSRGREQGIAELGAEVRRLSGTYDQVTAVNEEDARRNGWTVITDTSSTELRDPVVTDVMQGYRVLAQELVDRWAELRPTHLFLQAGCGGMAAAVAGHLVARLPDGDLPAVTVVEPVTAACLQASAAAGGPAPVTGDLATMMAGLSVGEVSLSAWEILRGCVDHYVAIPDDDVPTAMRLLGRPDAGHTPVCAGDTGAASIAALAALTRTNRAGGIDLTRASRVLTVNTEGDTDPDQYAGILADHRAPG